MVLALNTICNMFDYVYQIIKIMTELSFLFKHVGNIE